MPGRCFSNEGIDDAKPIECPARLQVFGKEYSAACLLRCLQDERVPEGEPVKTVEIDGSKYVAYSEYSDIEIGKQLNFPTRNASIHAELACRRDEILLKNLQRHHAGSSAAMFCHQVESTALLRRGCLVVGIDQDVGVEETTNAHEARLD